MEQSNQIKEMIKFALFSVSAGIVQAISFLIFNTLINLPWSISYIISLVLSIIWNFTFNRKFTFKLNNNIPIAMMKVMIFYLVFIPTSTMLGNLLITYHINKYIVTFINMTFNMILEYLYDKFIVFNNKIIKGER